MGDVRPMDRTALGAVTRAFSRYHRHEHDNVILIEQEVQLAVEEHLARLERERDETRELLESAFVFFEHTPSSFIEASAIDGFDVDAWCDKANTALSARDGS